MLPEARFNVILGSSGLKFALIFTGSVKPLILCTSIVKLVDAPGATICEGGVMLNAKPLFGPLPTTVMTILAPASTNLMILLLVSAINRLPALSIAIPVG